MKYSDSTVERKSRTRKGGKDIMYPCYGSPFRRRHVDVRDIRSDQVNSAMLCESKGEGIGIIVIERTRRLSTIEG